MMNIIKQNRTETIALCAVIIIVAAGIYFRLKGLGKWPFTNDEYYLAQSVRHILETGFPGFKCGGYYTRGLLYQYLMSPFIAMGLHPEWSFRMVPFLSYIIALPGLYKLSTKISGKFVALIILAVFSVSTLEIELSRFARMYMPFQALFIWYLYFLYRAIVDKDSRAYPWMLTLSFVGPMLFEAGIFLSILNFLPVLKEDKVSLRYLGMSIFVFLFACFYLSYDFRHFPHGLSYHWPPDIPMDSNIGIERGVGRVYTPYLLLIEMFQNPVWILPFLVPFFFSIWGAFKIFCNAELPLITRLSLILCLLFSVGNQFAMILVVILVLLLLDRIEPVRFKADLLKPLVLPIAANLIFWMIYALANSGEFGPMAILMSGGHPEALAEKIFNNLPVKFKPFSNLINIFIVLFYPIIGLLGILYKWLMVYPLIILALGAIIVFNIYFLIQKTDKKLEGLRFLLAIAILNITMVSCLNLRTGTRFTFFLYPIFLLLALVSIKQLADNFLRDGLKAKIATACIFISIFIITEDFNFNHVLNIDSAKINFRKNYGHELTRHYIMRRDYKGVAEVIEANAKDGDLVISAHQTVHYYTEKVNYIIFGYKNRQFRSYTACKGKKDSWTGANMIYQIDQLLDLTKHSNNNIWIVVNIAKPRYDEAEVIQRYKDKLFFEAQDGILGIFKLNQVE